MPVEIRPGEARALLLWGYQPFDILMLSSDGSYKQLPEVNLCWIMRECARTNKRDWTLRGTTGRWKAVNGRVVLQPSGEVRSLTSIADASNVTITAPYEVQTVAKGKVQCVISVVTEGAERVAGATVQCEGVDGEILVAENQLTDADGQVTVEIPSEATQFVIRVSKKGAIDPKEVTVASQEAVTVTVRERVEQDRTGRQR